MCKDEPRYLRDVLYFYTRRVKPNLNGEIMRDIDMGAAQRLMEKIAQAVPLASKSLSLIKWFLKAVFDVARIEGAYDSGRVNPFAEIKIPKTGKPRKPTRYGTLDTILDMIAALDHTSATVVALAAFSGLRKSEIQGLQWRDIRDGEIHVERAAWRTTKLETTKTDASRDSVPIIVRSDTWLGISRTTATIEKGNHQVDLSPRAGSLVVQTHAAKEALETRIGTQSVQHHARF
jgi:integrase